MSNTPYANEEKMLALVIANALLSNVIADSVFLNYCLVISEKMLALILENALLSDVIAHTRSGKNKMLPYDRVIVFLLTIA